MAARNAFAFPIGYYDLHPDVSLNFQFNRFWNWVGEARMLEEMRSVAPRIKSYVDWTRELLGLAEGALSRGRPIPAAYFTRMAEFFMWADDPRRGPARERFLEIVLREHQIHESARHSVPTKALGFLRTASRRIRREASSSFLVDSTATSRSGFPSSLLCRPKVSMSWLLTDPDKAPRWKQACR